MTRSRWSGFAAACVLSLVVTTPATAADHDVAIESFAFTPTPLPVSVGDRVTWTNRDDVLHTATAPGEWSTGDIVGGEAASIRVRTAGTYDYMCAVHPQMRGRLIVRAAGVPPTDGPPPRHPDPPLVSLAFLAVIFVLAARVASRRFRDDRTAR